MPPINRNQSEEPKMAGVSVKPIIESTVCFYYQIYLDYTEKAQISQNVPLQSNTKTRSNNPFFNMK